MEMNILSKANQLTQWLLYTFLELNTAYSKGDTSVGSSLLDSTGEYSLNVLWKCLIVVEDLWCIADISLTIIKLKQKDSRK